MMMHFLILIPLFLCWGSFLNVLAYRLVRHNSVIFPSSHCPFCHHTLAWYDLIPVLSWIALSGKCRHCAHRISWLYPCIEVLTAIVMSLMILRIPPHYYMSYFVFFSALIVTIRSDIETMLISRFASIFLAPVGILLATAGYLPISGMHSMIGAFFGYAALYAVSWFFYKFTQREGMGEGDMELLSCIGAFLGVYGAWTTIIISSCLGSLFSIAYILLYKHTAFKRIPFGPFLAIGAISYALFTPQLMYLFFGFN